MKMVLRQLFSDEYPRNEKNGIIYFKINEPELQSLMRELEEEGHENMPQDGPGLKYQRIM